MRERENQRWEERTTEREREKGRVTAGHHCSRLGGQWCPRRQDAIRAGWIVNGVLDDANMDEPWSKSESAREREREKSGGSKIALEQKEKKTERDRETNREGSIWRAVYGDVRSAMCRTIHTAMDRTILSYV